MKTFITTIIMLIACQYSLAQSVNSLFENFKHEQKAEYQSVSPFMMKIARLFMNDDDAESRFVKGIKSVKVLDLEECSAKVKESFKEQVSQLKLKGYEPLLTVKEDGETIKILAKTDEQSIRELLLYTVSQEECSAVLMKGKIRKEDIATIISDNQKKNNGRK